MDYKRHKRGRLRGDKVQYPDGIGCCIWYPFSELVDDSDDEDTGLCWDFEFDDIDDLISLLQELKRAEPNIYEEQE